MNKNNFGRLWNLIKINIKMILIITLLSIFTCICEIVNPYIVKVAIDDYLIPGVYKNGGMTITILGVIYICIMLFNNITEIFSILFSHILGEKVVYFLRNKLFRYIQNANMRFHDKTKGGKLFVRITNDVEEIAMLFTDVVSTIIKDVLLIIGLIAIMIYISYKLALISLSVIPFVIIFSIVLTKVLNQIYVKSKNIRTMLNSFLAESIYGAKLIKIFNIQKAKQNECEKLTNDFVKARIPSSVIEGLLPALLTVLENIGISLIVWCCLENWFGFSLQIGMTYIFITYLKQLFEPIGRIVENMEIIEESFVSIDKIYEILDKKEYLEKFESGEKLQQIKGEIEFKNVWFAYENENWVLQDVSFTIKPGESIALVGKTGSGKTTITNLINRFYEIQKGEILLDGVNIKNIKLRDLRRNIGTVLQDPFIFAKSIRDNVRLNKNISDEKIEDALYLSSSNEFVDKLPDGMDTISEERGNSFSAGQKQLLSFARIFAHNPNIFILDEATANIDTYTETLIQKSIDILLKEKTSIFIAHRLSTIVNVDKIIVLDKGKIIETGNHTELLNFGGYYSSLYNSYYESLG